MHIWYVWELWFLFEIDTMMINIVQIVFFIAIQET